MSTATPIPETVELTGDDAWETLRDAGRGRLLKDAFQRMRYADGFSHARSMAFLMTLVLVQGTIAVVGLASVLGTNRLTHGIVNAIHVIAPGPSGRILTSAVSQARQAGVSGDKLAIAFGALRRAGVGDHGDGPVGAGPEPALRHRTGPTGAAEVRPGVRPDRHRRAPPGGRLPGDRIRSRDRPGVRQRRSRHPLELVAVADGRPGDERRRGPALPLVSAPSPARLVVAHLRLLGLGRALVPDHPGHGAGVPGQQLVRRHLRPAGRDRGPAVLGRVDRHGPPVRRCGDRPARGREGGPTRSRRPGAR